MVRNRAQHCYHECSRLPDGGHLVLLLVPGPLRALGVDEDLQEVEQKHWLTGYLCKYEDMGEG